MSIRYTLRFLKEEDVNTDNLKRHELCLTDTGTIMVRLHNDEIVPLSYGIPLSSESSSSSSSSSSFGRSSLYDYSGNVGIKVNVTQSDHQMIGYSVYDRYNYRSNINFSMLTPPSEGSFDYGYWTESGIGKPIVPFIISLWIEDGYFGGRLQIEGDIEELRFENQYQPLELEMKSTSSKGVTKSSMVYPSLYKQKQVYVPLGGTLNISATPSLPIEHNYIVDFDGIELEYELSWTLPNSEEGQFEARRTSDGIIKDFPVGTEFELWVHHPDYLYNVGGYTATGTIDEYGICEITYLEPHDYVN